MSSNTPNNNDQEIDLRQVSQKMGQAYENFLSWIFRGFLFVKRNLIVLIVLFVIGAGIGCYLDKSNKVYESKIVVTANFGSVDYLYSKIELLKSKIFQGDLQYLESTGINDFKKIGFIKIEPIIDIYPFINNNPQNFELVKILGEEGSLEDAIKNNITSKNYPYHTITFLSPKKLNEESTVKSVMRYLNDSDFYLKVKMESNKNILQKIKGNDTIIAQIDRILNSISQKKLNTNLVYNNENNQLSDLIKTKESLIQAQANLKIDLINLDEVIKESSYTFNSVDNIELLQRNSIILPLLFLGLYLLSIGITRFYKSQIKRLVA